MRKVLPILLVLAMALPALATVEITAAGNGLDLEIYINTTAGEVVRGLAIELDSDGTQATGATVSIADFNAYIDYYFSNPDYLTVDLGGDENNLPGAAAQPLADPLAAGVATLPAEDVSLSLGVLDNTGAQGGYSTGGTPVLLATVSYNAAGCITITADALRGGVVGDGVTDVTVPGAPVCVELDECVASTSAFYADWVAFGKPDCWCFKKHCKGDADGVMQSSKVGSWWVGTNDLNVLIAPTVWGVYEPTAGPGIDGVMVGSIEAICADFDHRYQSSKVGTWRVGTGDLNRLMANWAVFEPTVGPGIPDCALDWESDYGGGDGVDDFNFWTN